MPETKMVDHLEPSSDEAFPCASPSSALVHPVHDDLKEALEREHAEEVYPIVAVENNKSCSHVRKKDVGESWESGAERISTRSEEGGDSTVVGRDLVPEHIHLGLLTQPSEDWFLEKGSVVKVTYIGDIDEIDPNPKDLLVTLPRVVGRRRFLKREGPSFPSSLIETPPGDNLSPKDPFSPKDPLQTLLLLEGTHSTNASPEEDVASDTVEKIDPIEDGKSIETVIENQNNENAGVLPNGENCATIFPGAKDSAGGVQVSKKPKSSPVCRDEKTDAALSSSGTPPTTGTNESPPPVASTAAEENTKNAPDDILTQDATTDIVVPEDIPENVTKSDREQECATEGTSLEHHAEIEVSTAEEATKHAVGTFSELQQDTGELSSEGISVADDSPGGVSKLKEEEPVPGETAQNGRALPQDTGELSSEKIVAEEDSQHDEQAGRNLVEEMPGDRNADITGDSADELDDLLDSLLDEEAAQETEQPVAVAPKNETPVVSTPTSSVANTPAKKKPITNVPDRKKAALNVPRKNTLGENDPKREKPVGLKPKKMSTLSKSTTRRPTTVPRGPTLATAARPARVKAVEPRTVSPPRPLKITVPQEPKFATTALLGEPKRPPPSTLVTLAQSTDVLRKALREESSKALSPPRITVPQAPHFATTDLLGKPKRESPSRSGCSSRGDSVANRSPAHTTVPHAPRFATTDILGEPKRPPSSPAVIAAQSAPALQDGLRKGMSKPSSPPHKTVPQAPHFATTDLLGEPGPPPGGKASMSQSTDVAKTNPPHALSAKASPRRALTVPKGPHLETEERLGRRDYKRVAGWDEYTLAQSTERLQGELRKDTPTHWKHRLTTPRLPTFRGSSPRKLPKSTAELEAEMMEHFESHPFKAGPITRPSSVGGGQHSKRLPTVPKPFSFHDRPVPVKTRSPSALQAEPEHFTFHARPMPDFGKAEVTEPPRSAKAKDNNPEPPTTHARPEPDFSKGLSSTKTV